MYNLEKINSMIRDIERFFLELKEIDFNEKNLKNIEKLHASSMLIFGIINRTVDIAQEIIVKNEWGMPQRYSESISILGNKGILDKKLSEELEKIVAKRGLFAHHYYSYKEKEVLKLSKDIYAVKTFLEKIKKEVQRSEKNKK